MSNASKNNSMQSFFLMIFVTKLLMSCADEELAGLRRV